MLGEIDLDREEEIPEPYREAPMEDVFALKKQQDMQRKRGDRIRGRHLEALGFEGEHSGEILF